MARPGKLRAIDIVHELREYLRIHRDRKDNLANIELQLLKLIRMVKQFDAEQQRNK